MDKLKDDLVIMVPSKDTVLFAPADRKRCEKMIEHGKGAYDMDQRGDQHVSYAVFPDEKELTPYEV